MDLVALGYSYTRIIHDYYVRNWKSERGGAKTTIAYRAISSYLADTEMHRYVDPTFKEPRDDRRPDEIAKQSAHQIDKFFSPHESVKLPYSFGDYLVMALDEDYRKPCLIELDRKRRTIVATQTPSGSNDDLMTSIQNTIKETSEAIAQLVELAPGGLGDDSDAALLRARQELDEAVVALQIGLGQLDDELRIRDVEIVSPD
ncbi:MAG: hypothetical protein CMQ05_05710 [Gammaproteobacteria bacterium]|nr:hypothetical protein [Gammaproteobacteria bacterium]RPG24153.1 MAG: hypothetical protein CBC10_012275 [Gammaproteobacteria bacterium TMED50]|tara:strand:- start:3875 stop:4480 length:606 start_codon:yes stop_codon:yes gene_type:complete